MLRTVSVALILAAGVGFTALAQADADIYRWKDAQGIYHYSDQWVPGSELIKSSSRQRPLAENNSSTSDSPPPASSSNSEPPEPEASSADVQAVKDDVAKVRAQQCKEAKDAYDKAIHARRITKDGKDGQKEFLSDAEADAYRIRVRGDVEHFCGTSPTVQ
jgi:hypothetical protein